MANQATDFAVLSDSDGNYDLIFELGDLKLVPSSEQHQAHLLAAAAGDFKNNPTRGVNQIKYLNSGSRNSPAALERVIREQFEADGLEIESLTVTR